MYRGKNTENDKSLQISRATNASRSIEAQGETIQKQIETYTRKFEEEKRRLFRAQENQREVFKDYQNQVTQLQGLKTKQFTTELSTLGTKIKCLQASLDKGISAYNDALSKNNLLKNQIDELRKDKKNQADSYKILTQKIEEINNSTKNMEESIQNKKLKVDRYKTDIINLRGENQKQYLCYRESIENMSKSLKLSSDLNQSMKNGTGKQTETSDTQPIVKLRLKNMIYKNKERIRIMDMYKKGMEKIEKSFEEIMEQSGIHDLQEITKTFLKQEDQNTFVYEYINKLTTELESTNEENQSLKQKIEVQEDKNNEYRSLLSGTPQARKRQAQIQQFVMEKNRPVEKMKTFLKDIQVPLFQLLNLDNGNHLTFLNIESYLAEVEKQIAQKFPYYNNEEIQRHVKEDATRYSKLVPTIPTEEIKDRNEDCILEGNRLRQYASEFWEKKRTTRN